MTLDMAKYFCGKAVHLEWYTFLDCSIFPTDSYETCKDKVFKVIQHYSSDSNMAWEYFKTIYNEIPVRFRMPLMMAVYQNHKVDYMEMLQYIANYIYIEETEELKAQRIADIKAVLKNRVCKDGTIMLYRGIAENHLLQDYAVSYTLDKKVAEFFIEYHKTYHQSRFGSVVKKWANIEDILCYSNDRKEREVFVIPFYVAGCSYSFMPSWDDMEYLDKDSIDEYCTYKEYETIKQELQKQGA